MRTSVGRLGILSPHSGNVFGDEERSLKKEMQSKFPVYVQYVPC